MSWISSVCGCVCVCVFIFFFFLRLLKAFLKILAGLSEHDSFPCWCYWLFPDLHVRCKRLVLSLLNLDDQCFYIIFPVIMQQHQRYTCVCFMNIVESLLHIVTARPVQEKTSFLVLCWASCCESIAAEVEPWGDYAARKAQCQQSRYALDRWGFNQ